MHQYNLLSLCIVVVCMFLGPNTWYFILGKYLECSSLGKMNSLSISSHQKPIFDYSFAADIRAKEDITLVALGLGTDVGGLDTSSPTSELV